VTCLVWRIEDYVDVQTEDIAVKIVRQVQVRLPIGCESSFIDISALRDCSRVLDNDTPVISSDAVAELSSLQSFSLMKSTAHYMGRSGSMPAVQYVAAAHSHGPAVGSPKPTKR
jgi:hypothetical protein